MHWHDPLDDVVGHAWRSALSRRQNAWDLPFDGPLTLQAIWTMVDHLLITRYLIVASFALGFYDYFLTLSQERTYVWESRPSVVRSIYLFVRYSYFPIGILTLYGECAFERGETSSLDVSGATNMCVHHITNLVF